eukprot:366304-Chlamydomonas_euryale.AAC.3
MQAHVHTARLNMQESMCNMGGASGSVVWILKLCGVQLPCCFGHGNRRRCTVQVLRGQGEANAELARWRELATELEDKYVRLQVRVEVWANGPAACAHGASIHAHTELPLSAQVGALGLPPPGAGTALPAHVIQLDFPLDPDDWRALSAIVAVEMLFSCVEL